MSKAREGAIPLRERRTVAEEWKEFRKLIPEYAPDVQVTEMRRAFYCGATAVFGLMTDLDSGSDATDLDLEYYVSLEKELEDFQEAIARGEA